MSPLISTLGYAYPSRGYGIGGAAGEASVSRYGLGTLSAQNISGNPNINAHFTDSTIPAGTSTVTVNSTSGMTAGDMVFIHQTVDDTAANAGNYMINRIESISGNNVTLADPLNTTYYSGAYNNTNRNSSATQMVVSPAYSSVTANGRVLAKQWDGQSGGILFITATEQIVSGSNYYSAYGRGYRGGQGSGTGTQSNGYAGESLRGWYNAEYTVNDSGGAGAGGNTNSGGDSGGSGGHAQAGGGGNDGGGTVNGGNAVGNAAMDQIFFGGGAGAGGDNDDRSFGGWVNPNNGGNESLSNWTGFASAFTDLPAPSGNRAQYPDISGGGGIVVLMSPSIPSLRSTVRGIPPFYGSSAGSKSGAGASGSIYIVTNDGGLSITDVTVAQQAQATSPQDGDTMGPGSAGRIRLDIYGGSSYTGSFTTTGSGSTQVNTNLT